MALVMRKIIHVDMDCFFAAIEMRDNPSLQQWPIAVGGASDRRGVIATCNYLARRYGVRSAMATAHALKLCPSLKVLPPRMQAYKAASAEMLELFANYTDLIEPLSLDEAYLDVSESRHCQGSATLIAEQIRMEIQQQLGITASAGVAPNKFLAKIASEKNKPNGQYVITPEQVDLFVRDLPLEKIPGVGKVTLARLNQLNYFVAEDIQRAPLAVLTHHFGKFGETLHERCHGRDERDVQTSRIRKSIGVETTLVHDVFGLQDCEQVLVTLLEELTARIERSDVWPRIARCGVKVKFSDFRQTSVEHSYVKLKAEFFMALLKEALRRP